MSPNLPAIYLPSVPAAMSALKKLEDEGKSAKTYEQLKKAIGQAKAIKLMYDEWTEVRHGAEWTLLSLRRVLGIRIRDNVPKGNKHQFPLERKLTRSDLPFKHDSRAKLLTLARISERSLRELVDDLHATKHEATLKAILGLLREGRIKTERAQYEARASSGKSATKIDDLIATGDTFNVIYADPPWSFEVYSGKGKQRSAERYYDTMSLADLQKLPVQKLAGKNCALFLWAVSPELPGALDVISSWGFEYKTVAFCWVKQNRSGNGIFTGMGYWTRANVELCLLATRGAPHRIAKNVHQVVESPLAGHSVKPDEVADRIARLLNGPYLEMFGRKPRAGWTVWGNELSK